MKDMKKQRKIILILLIGMVLITGIVASIYISKEIKSNWILDKAKEHIVSYVGEDYFNEHISVKRNETKSKIDKIGAKYRIDYIYKFKIKGDADETSIEFPLWLDPDGELLEYRGIKYRGPQKPYIFNISREEAEEIAKSEGIKEIESISIVLGLMFNGDKGNIGESYVWHVSSKSPIGGELAVVYVDVDSGNIIDVATELEAETILPVESYVCCKGITFYSEGYAEEAGYTDCTPRECENLPTPEEKQEWICPKWESIGCMPVIPPQMLPYCTTPYSSWIAENCNVSFTY